MTENEFDATMREMREHVERTSFGPPPEGDTEDQEFGPADHAEYGAAMH